MARKIPTRQEALALVGVCCVAGLLLGVWMYVIGAAKPIEANRVMSPNGFSIIRPADWEFTIQANPPGRDVSDFIELRPSKFKGHIPTILVSRYATTPTKESYEAASYSRTTFQDQPAMLLDTRKKNNRVIRVAFSRGNASYEITAVLPDWEGAKDAEYWQYLNTFRLETPIKGLTATTHLAPLAAPSTLPTTNPR